jgi:nucleotide-binding universal stress UspA family protein
MTHVLIAVDDTETSVRAASTAHRLFGDDARYTVINVARDASLMWGETRLETGAVYPLVPMPGLLAGAPLGIPAATAPDQVVAERVEAAEEHAGHVAEEAGLSGARPVGDVGDTSEAILAAAEAFGADVIVLGTHDRGWFSRLVKGSVASDVLREAEIPVLIAR